MRRVGDERSPVETVDTDIPRDDTPWAAEARELEKDPNISYYADYTAWERWMFCKFEVPCPFGNEDKDCKCAICEAARWWDDASVAVKAQLYTAFHDACAFLRPKEGE